MSENISQKTFRQSVFMVLLKNLIVDKGSVTITHGDQYDSNPQWVINFPGSSYICGSGVTGETMEKAITNAWYEAQDEGSSFTNHENFDQPSNV